MTYLDEQRRANAQAAFEAHLFDRGGNPEEADGWEHQHPGNTWSRTVYFPNTEEEDGPTVSGRYTVEFEPKTAEIKSAYASINGNDIGEYVPVRAFVIDPTAPRLKADYERSSFADVAPILDGLQEIWSTDQDNDAERWSLTAAGQVLRQTGLELDRYYVVPRKEAIDYLTDLLEPHVLEGLRVAGALDLGYTYLTDRQGIDYAELTADPADQAATKRLRKFHPKNGTGFIAKNADGVYGIVLEGAEYPYEDTKDFVDEDWYEGRVVNGQPLEPDTFPTLEEIERHIAVEVAAIAAKYPGIENGSFRGDDTFDGHVTHVAFIPEDSPYISRTTEIGKAMSDAWTDNMTPTASPAP